MRPDTLEEGPKQLQVGKAVARALVKEHGTGDVHEVVAAHALAASRGVKGEPKEDQPRRALGVAPLGARGQGSPRVRAAIRPGFVGGPQGAADRVRSDKRSRPRPLRHQRGTHSPPHRLPTREKRQPVRALFTRAQRRGHHREEPPEVIGPLPSRLRVLEVVAQRGDPLARQRLGSRLHPRMGHGRAGAVSEDQEAGGGPRLGKEPRDGGVAFPPRSPCDAVVLAVVAGTAPHRAARGVEEDRVDGAGGARGEGQVVSHLPEFGADPGGDAIVEQEGVPAAIRARRRNCASGSC